MTVENWVFEAIEALGSSGARVQDIQRYIDEHRFEELAIDTIETALSRLTAQGRIVVDGTRYRVAQRTSKEDAMKKLFGS